MNAGTIIQLFKLFFLILIAYPPIKYFYFNMGLRWLIILVFSVLLASFLTPFCRMAAVRTSVLDEPDWRKIHDTPTPLFGGISVYLAFMASLSLNGIFLPGMKAILLGASLIFFLGLWDDIKPLPALLKLVIQVLVAFLVVIPGNIQITFFYSSAFSPFVNIPLTVIWLVGITNSMNFFDGIDGLAISLSIIIAAFLGSMAFNTDQPALGWFAIALIGSCIGFMPYNFRFGKSAELFLGDAGSTFLGFTLAGLAVLGQWSNTSRYVSVSSPILIFGVLIFDMIYVNLSRIKNRQAKNFRELLACVNKDHLHHRLLFMGFARKEAVFIISIISTCLGVSALIIMNQKLIDALLGLFQAVLIFGLIVSLMLKGREKTPKDGE
ncbi:MAG: undecaprenyl/decaprenyl-phosphate alpha-N-acetylglucosaminyl 1-phosphate transferase [Deltaproteobacteria bacterium]|nr:undecaprenyl/decaprenyl-phosphate alpha-N-acetylglucosaminyl 1-phosphate transferase [Deltaproteobacteria bacterium]